MRLPEPAIEQTRTSPAFPALVGIAQSTIYDTEMVDLVSTPTAAMLQVDVPTSILRGEPTMPLLVSATERLAAAMPHAELVVVPESRDHGVDPDGTVRVIRERMA